MKKQILIISSLVLIAVALISFNDKKYFELNKGFEVFGAILKEVNKNYVNEVTSEELFEAAINGMLEELDPYTSYFPEKDKEDIELITYGHYVGFGINIRHIDGKITVTGISDDFIAYDGGLRIGDRIYKIDGEVVEGLSSDELKQYTQGSPNSIAEVEVIRFKDTLSLKLVRHNVEVSNVSYYGMLENNIGYIKLERFSRNSANDFRKAYFDLANENELSGLIIDLRDNPGGLLEASLDICEMFLPKGSVLLSTKGRSSIRNYTYKSYSEPVDTITPLCVIINEGSASASEIVAGCLQDYDRAIITGNQSFGKGLVQTVMDLPYNANLKITTAKYYTPSGRCIQRVEYDKNKLGEKDTNIFYTKAGRKVFENKGIIPDTTILEYKYTDYTRKIYNSNAFFDFANEYLIDREIDIDFEIDSTVVYDFKSYLIDKSLLTQSKTSDYLDDLYEVAANDEILEIIEEDLDKLSQKLMHANKKLFVENIEEIKLLLDYEFKRRYYNSTQLVDKFKDKDSILIKSASLLNRPSYNLILKAPENQESKQ